MMMDWSPGVESRNYRILRRSDRRGLLDMLSSILCILGIGGALVAYLWSSNRIMNMGYEAGRLQEAEKALLRTHNSLILEEETLKTPQRIDFFARTSLGMELLQPNQLISGFRGIEADRAAVLAMAGEGKAVVPARRSAAND